MTKSKDGKEHRGREAQARKKIGRPRIIESPEEMDRLVQEYTVKCHEDSEPLTLTGLILSLGLSCRDSFDEYGRRPEFSDSVKGAKLLIENGYEVDLRKTGNPAGSIFALKNMGWSDRQEIEFRGVMANLDLTKLPDDLVARIAAGESAQAVLAGAVSEGLDPQSFLKQPPVPLGLPAASAEDGGAEDAAGPGPPHPVDRATSDR